MAPFVGMALKVCERLEIIDTRGRSFVMRFCKIYPPEKMGRIVEKAESFPWHLKLPTAAFMKAVGEVNREEKQSLTKPDEVI